MARVISLMFAFGALCASVCSGLKHAASQGESIIPERVCQQAGERLRDDCGLRCLTVFCSSTYR